MFRKNKLFWFIPEKAFSYFWYKSFGNIFKTGRRRRPMGIKADGINFQNIWQRNLNIESTSNDVIAERMKENILYRFKKILLPINVLTHTNFVLYLRMDIYSTLFTNTKVFKFIWFGYIKRYCIFKKGQRVNLIKHSNIYIF